MAAAAWPVIPAIPLKCFCRSPSRDMNLSSLVAASAAAAAVALAAALAVAAATNVLFAVIWAMSVVSLCMAAELSFASCSIALCDLFGERR